jgi:hypothetical protein
MILTTSRNFHTIPSLIEHLRWAYLVSSIRWGGFFGNVFFLSIQNIMSKTKSFWEKVFFSPFGWQGYSPRFFVIFCQKNYFCFNGLRCSFGSNDTWTEKEIWKKLFLEWKLDDEMYNKSFWNTLYLESGIPIELKLAGFNRLHELLIHQIWLQADEVEN